MTHLEHVNITVADPDHTAALLCSLFDWQVRWAGTAMQSGRAVHVGSTDCYVALFSFGDPVPGHEVSYRTRAGLNRIAVVGNDLDAAETRIKTAGYTPENHADYATGSRFYCTEENGIEVVSYPLI